MAKETKFEEKKKLFLNKIEVFNFDVNKKKVDIDTLMYQNIRDTLSKSFYVELKDKNTDKSDFYSSEKIDTFLSMMSGEKAKNNTLKDIDLTKTEVNIYKINKEDLDEVSKNITYYSLAKRHTEKDDGIRETIKNAFEKATPITFTKEMEDKAKNFQNALSKFENAFKEYKGTENSYKIIKKNGEEYYSVAFTNKKTEKEEKIVARDLEEFKDKVVDFLENKISKATLEELKEVDLKDLETNTNRDFSLTFDKNNYEKYELKISGAKNDYVLEKKVLNDISLNLVSDDYSELLECRKIGESYGNIDYLKEENKVLYKQLEENVKTETLEEIENDIIYRSLADFDNRSRENGNYREKMKTDNLISDVKNRIDSLYESRVLALNDEEKIALVERSSDYFELKLNSDGKIEELANGSEEDYKKGINELLEFGKSKIEDKFETDFKEYKEKAPSVSPDIDFEKMDAKDKDFHTNVRALGITRRMFTSDLKSETMDIQREIEKNIGLILTANNNLNENEKFRLYDEEKKDFNDSANQKIIDKFYKEFSEDYLKNTESFYKAPTREDFVESFSTTKHIFGFELGKNEIKIPNDKENMKEVEKTDKDKFDKEKDF